MISIVIPVFNAGPYLRRCIDSIIAQSYREFEVILIDDGSRDESPTICDEYSMRYPYICVVHQTNAGVSAARNVGISLARGEWITFIDSDDWVEKEYLNNFAMDTDDADLIIQGLEYYDDRNHTFFKQIHLNNCILGGDELTKKVEENNVLELGYPVAKAYRRSLIGSRIIFDTSISYHEDHIFVLNCLSAASKIRLVDSIAYKYRYFHTNTSLSSKRHSWQNLNIASNGMLRALDTIKDKYLEYGSDYERRIYNYAYSPKISAVFELFREPIPDKEKYSSLCEIIDKEQIEKYYRPSRRKDKFIKSLLVCRVFIIQNLFFKFYFMIKSDKYQ